MLKNSNKFTKKNSCLGNLVAKFEKFSILHNYLFMQKGVFYAILEDETKQKKIEAGLCLYDIFGEFIRDDIF